MPEASTSSQCPRAAATGCRCAQGHRPRRRVQPPSEQLAWGSRECWLCMGPAKPTATSAMPRGKPRDSVPIAAQGAASAAAPPANPAIGWPRMGRPRCCSSCRPAISSEEHLAEVMYEPGQVGRPWRPGFGGASRLHHRVKGRSAFFAQAGIPSPVPAGSAKRRRWAAGTVP